MDVSVVFERDLDRPGGGAKILRRLVEDTDTRISLPERDPASPLRANRAFEPNEVIFAEELDGAFFLIFSNGADAPPMYVSNLHFDSVLPPVASSSADDDGGLLASMTNSTSEPTYTASPEIIQRMQRFLSSVDWSVEPLAPARFRFVQREFLPSSGPSSDGATKLSAPSSDGATKLGAPVAVANSISAEGLQRPSPRRENEERIRILLVKFAEACLEHNPEGHSGYRNALARNAVARRPDLFLAAVYENTLRLAQRNTDIGWLFLLPYTPRLHWRCAGNTRLRLWWDPSPERDISETIAVYPKGSVGDWVTLRSDQLTPPGMPSQKSIGIIFHSEGLEEDHSAIVYVAFFDANGQMLFRQEVRKDQLFAVRLSHCIF